jgi:hypothetical protein
LSFTNMALLTAWITKRRNLEVISHIQEIVAQLLLHYLLEARTQASGCHNLNAAHLQVPLRS